MPRTDLDKLVETLKAFTAVVEAGSVKADEDIEAQNAEAGGPALPGGKRPLSPEAAAQSASLAEEMAAMR